jgi:hypothetical protein
MADVNENPNNEAKQLSPEELAERRAQITKYYEEHIPSLKVQLEYETLLRDIEKSRAERLQAQMFVAKSMSAPPEAPGMPPAVNNPAPQNPNMAREEFEAAQKKEAVANTEKPVKRTLKKKANATK